MVMAAAAVALIGGGLWVPPQKARAQALQPAVDVCTGITLPRSAVTEIIGAVNQPIVDQIETTVNGITTVTLVLAPLASITGLDIDLSSILADAEAGDPISLQVLDTEGNVITASDDCNLTADNYTLNNEGGISIGGNQISGLGANGQAASAGEADAIAFGNNASTAVGATGAVAIGTGASATAADSVALGAGSVADRENTVSVGSAGDERQIVNVADGTAATDAATVGQVNTSIAAAVADSVEYDDATQATLTLGGAGGTRISNVAAGTLDAASTDAVNGAQLFATNENVTANATAITTLDGRVTTNTGDITTLDGRITTNAGDIATLDGRVTTNAGDIATLDGRVTTNAGDITALDGRVTTNAGDITALDGRITTNAGDITALDGRIATNEGDITALDGRLATSEGDITALDGRVSGTEARISINEADIAALQDFSVAYDDASQTGVTLGGAGGTTISNVAAGRLDATSSDAVNGAQLFATNETVATNTADIAALDGRVQLNADELDTVNGRLQLTEDELADLQGSVVAYDDGAQGTITLNGAGGTVITNVAAGSVDAASTDAVNGAQLFATNQNVATNATNITTLDGRVTLNENELVTINGRLQLGEDELADLQDSVVTYDDDTQGTVTLAGADGTVVTNVAAGSVAAGSTDAVNGAQLFATNQGVATNEANIALLDGRVTLNQDELATINGRLQLSEEELAALQGSAVTYDDETQGTVTLAGAEGTVVRNVAAASISAASSDAVNGGQVFRISSNVASLIGGDTSFDPATGQFVGSLQFDGATYSDVQGALTAIDAAIAAIEGGGPGGGTAGAGDFKYFNTTSVAADSQARATDSTAIGPNSIANAEGAIAAGRDTRAMSEGSVAIGDGSMALSGKAVVIGYANQASGDGAVAIGDPNIAMGDGAVALGRDNEATGVGTVALGDTNIITGDGAVGIGRLNQATGSGTLALGDQNAVNGNDSIALGTTNQITGSQSLALGSGNVVNADAAIAIGSNVVASEVDALAIGNDAQAMGSQSVAFGNRATATGVNASAIGVDAEASDSFATAVGEGANAVFAATALGSRSNATFRGAIAIGVGSQANAEGTIALGSNTAANRGAVESYTAFGVTGEQSSAGELAIGRTLPPPNNPELVPLGGRQITGVAAGSADDDAVNVAQLRGIAGNLGTAMASGLGGGSTYDPETGTVSAPTYTVNGTAYSNVADAISGVASVSLQYDDVTQATVTLAGAGGTVITNVAAGTVSATSSDAVNGAQLAATNAAVVQNTSDIQAITSNLAGSTVVAVQYSSPGSPTVSNGGTITNDVTLVGADASAPVALHNVAAGVAPTDAVNVQQLQTGMASTLASAMNYTDARIQQIGFDLAELRDDAFAGTAAAMAMNAIPQTMDAGSSVFGGAVGHYRGKTAFGFGLSSAFADGQAVLKVSGTIDTQGKGGVAAGAGFAF